MKQTIIAIAFYQIVAGLWGIYLATQGTVDQLIGASGQTSIGLTIGLVLLFGFGIASGYFLYRLQKAGLYLSIANQAIQIVSFQAFNFHAASLFFGIENIGGAIKSINLIPVLIIAGLLLMWPRLK